MINTSQNNFGLFRAIYFPINKTPNILYGHDEKEIVLCKISQNSSHIYYTEGKEIKSAPITNIEFIQSADGQTRINATYQNKDLKNLSLVRLPAILGMPQIDTNAGKYLASWHGENAEVKVKSIKQNPEDKDVSITQLKYKNINTPKVGVDIYLDNTAKIEGNSTANHHNEGFYHINRKFKVDAFIFQDSGYMLLQRQDENQKVLVSYQSNDCVSGIGILVEGGIEINLNFSISLATNTNNKN